MRPYSYPAFLQLFANFEFTQLASSSYHLLRCDYREHDESFSFQSVLVLQQNRPRSFELEMSNISQDDRDIIAKHPLANFLDHLREPL